MYENLQYIVIHNQNLLLYVVNLNIARLKNKQTNQEEKNIF